MKKTILATVAVMMTAMTAQAKMYCSVSAEGKPLEYTKNLALVERDETQKHQVIFTEGDRKYIIGQNEDMTEISVYSEKSNTVYALVSAKTSGPIFVLLPQLKRAVACNSIELQK